VSTLEDISLSKGSVIIINRIQPISMALPQGGSSGPVPLEFCKGLQRLVAPQISAIAFWPSEDRWLIFPLHLLSSGGLGMAVGAPLSSIQLADHHSGVCSPACIQACIHATAINPRQAFHLSQN